MERNGNTSDVFFRVSSVASARGWWLHSVTVITLPWKIKGEADMEV